MSFRPHVIKSNPIHHCTVFASGAVHHEASKCAWCDISTTASRSASCRTLLSQSPLSRVLSVCSTRCFIGDGDGSSSDNNSSSAITTAATCQRQIRFVRRHAECEQYWMLVSGWLADSRSLSGSSIYALSPAEAIVAPSAAAKRRTRN
jgi:hypothetical protein